MYLRTLSIFLWFVIAATNVPLSAKTIRLSLQQAIDQAVSELGNVEGVGLLISTVSGSQQQAMMGSFFFFLPAFMLSGFAFPIANMPAPVQYLTLLNPLRYFLEIVRGVFLKGTGGAEHLCQITALLIFGLGLVALSALRFTKRLD